MVVFLRNNYSHEALASEVQAFLRNSLGGVALLDFPFGLAEATVAALGLPPDADPPAVWRAVSGAVPHPPSGHGARAGRSGKGSERLHKRETDFRHQTPFAPHNLRVYRQTFAGMALLSQFWEVRLPIFPWSDLPNCVGGWLGEGCPKSTLIALNLTCDRYKAGTDRRRVREDLVRSLERSQGLRWSDPRLRGLVITDVEGDALDATLLALSASSVNSDQLTLGRTIANSRPTEGVVYV